MADHENSSRKMFLFVGAYSDERTATDDYNALIELHKDGWVGSYDAGIVTKIDGGKLQVKRHTDSTGTGAKRGLAVGVLMGIIAPSILVSGAVGAGAGAAIGHSFNAISKDDLEQLGRFLEDNEAALVVIGELEVQKMLNRAAKSAIKEYKKEFNADAKEFNKQLDEAMKDL